MTTKQKYAMWTIIVAIALIAFLWYYFSSTKKEEKCPDGRSIPSSGNCSDNPVIRDNNGDVIVTPAIPDTNGCIQPSSYIPAFFPIGLGMKGDTVKQLQTSLNVQFKAKLKQDGYFGCKTLDALKKAFNVEAVDAELFKNKIQATIPEALPNVSVYETPTA